MIILECIFTFILLLFTYFENDKFNQLYIRQKKLNIEEENYHID